MSIELLSITLFIIWYCVTTYCLAKTEFILKHPEIVTIGMFFAIIGNCYLAVYYASLFVMNFAFWTVIGFAAYIFSLLFSKERAI
jgi:hypothetical protein